MHPAFTSLVFININDPTASGEALPVGLIAIPVIWVCRAVLWVRIAPPYFVMALGSIDTCLIAVAILLLTDVCIRLRLILRTGIADVLGIDALNRARFTRLIRRRNIFIAIGRARRNTQYCKAK